MRDHMAKPFAFGREAVEHTRPDIARSALRASDLMSFAHEAGEIERSPARVYPSDDENAFLAQECEALLNHLRNAGRLENDIEFLACEAGRQSGFEIAVVNVDKVPKSESAQRFETEGIVLPHDDDLRGFGHTGVEGDRLSDRSGTDDEHPIAACHSAFQDGFLRNGQWFGERCELVVDAVRRLEAIDDRRSDPRREAAVGAGAFG
nr:MULTISPECIES: hypothetical protein [Methylosinus]